MRAIFHKMVRNPEFWFLLFYNLLIFYLYFSKSLDPRYIVWAYFLQSLYIGGQYIIYKLTGDLNIPWQKKFRTILFFIFHFGIFHFVYLIFILILSARNNTGGGLELFHYIRWNALLLLGGLFLTLLRELAERTPTHSKAKLIVPYARVVPMHILIILSMTYSLANPWVFGLFIVLKTVGDVILAFIFHGEDKFSVA
jgi:hypothetical protein